MDENIPLRLCIKCGQSFPATPQFFYRRSEVKSGFRAACIACENPTRKPPKEPDPEGMKRCTKCEKLLPATREFFRIKRGGLGSSCKACTNVQGKAYYDVHKDERKQKAQERAEERRAYRQQYHAAHKEEQHRRQSRWYQLHKEENKAYQRRYNEAHSELIRERRKKYMQTPRGRMIKNALEHKRNARKKLIEGHLTAEQIQAKLKAQRYCCYYAACGHARFEKVNGLYVYHLEHTIPLSRTEAIPRNDVNYVVLSCPSCNLSKHNKLPHEWSAGGRLF